MKQSIKQKRALEKLNQLAAQYGGKTFDVSEAQSHIREHVVSQSDKLEGVLASIRRPGDYTYRRCKRKNCGAPFGANYHAVAYCSDLCRIRDFEDTTGIKWNGSKSPEERWGGEPPSIITPDVIATMLPYAERIIEEFHRLGMTKLELQQAVEGAQTPEQKLEQPVQEDSYPTTPQEQPSSTMSFLHSETTVAASLFGL